MLSPDTDLSRKQRNVRQLLRSLPPEQWTSQQINHIYDNFLAPPAQAAMPVLMSDLMIRDEHANLIPLIPNNIQELYLDEILPNWRRGDLNIRGKQYRERLLKARQEGLSTIIFALIFLDTINNPHTYSMIVANNSDNTQKLFDVVRRFYDFLPEKKKPKARNLSITELRFEGLDSVLYVGSPGSRALGRGQQLQNLHLSERAFWEQANPNVEVGLKEAAKMGNIWEETTANGLNDWERMYREAQAGVTSEGQKCNYHARFFPWHAFAKYAIDPESDFKRTAQEEGIATLYGLSDRQLAWRRWKLGDYDAGKRHLFLQEFPMTVDEAFMATSINNYFPVEYLNSLIKYLEEWDAQCYT